MNASDLKYGDLVVSTAHGPQARGPYMVLYSAVRSPLGGDAFVVCLSLDGTGSINIPLEACVPFKVSKEIWKIVGIHLDIKEDWR